MTDRFYREKADHDALARKDEMIAEAAAFLDEHARFINTWPDRRQFEKAASDCRAMAKRLRGET